MGRRPLLVMVLGWFAVVGAVGAITFVVVSNAGSGVGRASAAERVVVVSPTASQSGTATVPVTQTPSRTPTPSLSLTPTPTSSATTRRPDQTPDAPDAPDAAQTSRAPRPTAPAVDPHTASFSSEAGIVVASCRGSNISLVSIRPRDGWGFEQSITKATIEVHFKRPEREVQVSLKCVNAVPTRYKAGSHWGVGDTTSSESPSRPVVRPGEVVHSEVPAPATPVASSTPSSTEETTHG